MESLNDKVAVITGSSRGIGRGVAEAFLDLGLKVGLCAQSPAEAVEHEIDPDRALYHSLDVSDLPALEAFADDVEKALGPIDLWVNNAGLLEPIGMAREVDPVAWRRLIEVNVIGVYHGARVFLRRLHAAHRRGALVNITSGASTSPYRGWSAYGASKAAVDQMTRILAEEEEPYGIRVRALAPGVIETRMQELIRAQDASSFPDVERFRTMHVQGALKHPGAPASAILELAFGDQKVTDPVVDARDLA